MEIMSEFPLSVCDPTGKHKLHSGAKCCNFGTLTPAENISLDDTIWIEDKKRHLYHPRNVSDVQLIRR